MLLNCICWAVVFNSIEALYPVLWPEGQWLKKQPPRRCPPLPASHHFNKDPVPLPQRMPHMSICWCLFFQHVAASPWLNALTVITILCCHHFLWYTKKMMYLQHRHRSFFPSFLLGWHPCTVRESVQEAGVSIYRGCVHFCGVCVLFYWCLWIQLYALTVVKLVLHFGPCVLSSHIFK